MKTLFLFCLLICLNDYGDKQPIVRSSSISFSILNGGFEVAGTLKVVRAEIKFDPQNLRESYIHAFADPASIETGISVRDKHLKRSDYFDVARYPQIQLRSHSFTKTGRLSFVGKFDVTIKGVTKTIEIPFTVKREKQRITYETRFELNRLDFNLGERSVILDNIVTINVQLHA